MTGPEVDGLFHTVLCLVVVNVPVGSKVDKPVRG